MKTAILQCLQQFSSKNSRNLYHDRIIKKLKLQFAKLCKTFVLASNRKPLIYRFSQA